MWWERTVLRFAYVLVGILSLAWLGATSTQAAAPEFPALTGRVVDEAGVLSGETKRDLDGILAGDEQKFGGRQIVVVTVKSLQGHEIEDYGYQLGRHWGIGEKGKNDGALVIVAPNEHRVRIEVGYGLEGTLTDAKSRIIIERLMTPNFRQGDYDAGVIAGAKAVLATLGNTDYATPDYQAQGEDEPPGWMTALFIFLMIVFFAGRSFFWPLLFMGGFGGGRGGWGGGGWGGGSGGGGFSGGGGSFGGGGASGRW